MRRYVPLAEDVGIGNKQMVFRHARTRGVIRYFIRELARCHRYLRSFLSLRLSRTRRCCWLLKSPCSHAARDRRLTTAFSDLSRITGQSTDAIRCRMPRMPMSLSGNSIKYSLRQATEKRFVNFIREDAVFFPYFCSMPVLFRELDRRYVAGRSGAVR